MEHTETATDFRDLSEFLTTFGRLPPTIWHSCGSRTAEADSSDARYSDRIRSTRRREGSCVPELATSHYRGRNLAEKVRAGFSIYAHAEDASRLRRVLDQRELTAEILSL